MLITEYAELSLDGKDWTGAFRAAVDGLERRGGGELRVPAGVFPTGPVRLKSHMTLRLEAGSVLRFHDDFAAYPPMEGEFEGVPGSVHTPCVYAEGAENVGIAGEGTLDGNGGAWWRAFRAGTLAHPRPNLVCLRECRKVAVEGVRLVNSPCWTVHPLYCEDVLVRGVTIVNPADSPNTDGVNPNGCGRVRIARCYIDVGDDCIAIKAGTEDTPNPRPCEDIVVEGCTMAHGHGGVVIGSEMTGGVRGVTVSGCVMRRTDRGVRVKTRRGRGGVAENLSFSDIVMEDVGCPFVVNMYYCCGKGGRSEAVRDKGPRPAGPDTPAVRGIRVSRVEARRATACAGFFHGLPESPIEGLSLTDCAIAMAAGTPGFPAMQEGARPMEAAGLYLRNAHAALRNVSVTGQRGPAADKGE